MVQHFHNVDNRSKENLRILFKWALNIDTSMRYLIRPSIVLEMHYMWYRPSLYSAEEKEAQQQRLLQQSTTVSGRESFPLFTPLMRNKTQLLGYFVWETTL